MHSLLHCHFESALRALVVTRPGDIEQARAAFESRAYARATPAGRLSLLDRQVGRITQGQDVFTREVFAEVVRRLGKEMTSSGIRHIPRPNSPVAVSLGAGAAPPSNGAVGFRLSRSPIVGH